MGCPFVSRDKRKVQPIAFISKINFNVTFILTLGVRANLLNHRFSSPNISCWRHLNLNFLINIYISGLLPDDTSLPSDSSVVDSVNEKDKDPSSLKPLPSRPRDSSELDKFTIVIITWNIQTDRCKRKREEEKCENNLDQMLLFIENFGDTWHHHIHTITRQSIVQEMWRFISHLTGMKRRNLVRHHILTTLLSVTI